MKSLLLLWEASRRQIGSKNIGSRLSIPFKKTCITYPQTIHSTDVTLNKTLKDCKLFALSHGRAIQGS